MSTEEIVVAGAVRTPIGSFGGGLTPLSAVELGTLAARAALTRTGLEPGKVDFTLMGHGRQAGCGTNPGRQVSVRAGIPVETPALTLNMACASGMKTIQMAALDIRAGEAEVVLAGGMESMSNTPYMLPAARWGYRLGDAILHDGMYLDGFICPLAEQKMGVTAETLAERYDLSRREQDEYAVESQARCQRAREAGLFDAETFPVEVPGRKGPVVVSTDEHPRDGVTVKKLAKLPPVFKEDGTVHAGNSSGITDGAAAMLVMSRETAGELGVEPQARLAAWATSGLDPAIMGLGPVEAVRKLLARTGLDLADIDLIELNEAFAAQLLACQRELDLDLEKTNVNGGAIALGHPIGATGTRICVTLLSEMERRDARYGLAALCVSGGMGMALLFQR